MSKIIFSIVLIFVIDFNACFGKNLSCEYIGVWVSRYFCELSIQNPKGLNNFLTIDGVHLDGKTDDDVLAIQGSQGSQSANIPSIICEKFKNLEDVWFNYLGIKAVSKKSLKGCANLVNLELKSNQIEEIAENAFSSLKNLSYIALDNNKIKVIHSNWFADLSKINDFQMRNNLVYAIDKKFVMDSGSYKFDMYFNWCVDGSYGKDVLMGVFADCFENYESLEAGKIATLNQ